MCWINDRRGSLQWYSVVMESVKLKEYSLVNVLTFLGHSSVQNFKFWAKLEKGLEAFGKYNAPHISLSRVSSPQSCPIA